MKRIARIFEDVGGIYVCPEDGPLDTRGEAYPNSAAARSAAWHAGYTHAVGSGVGGKEVRLRKPKYADEQYRKNSISYQGW